MSNMIAQASVPTSPSAIRRSSFTPSVRGFTKHTTPHASRSVRLVVRADKVLIANTKGGGHAPFGLYLAKKLVSQGHNVTILNDGDDSLTAKAPFSQYAGFWGCNVVWGNPSDPSVFPAGTFDIVYDNNGKVK
jgi:hypothetical protein